MKKVVRFAPSGAGERPRPTNAQTTPDEPRRPRGDSAKQQRQRPAEVQPAIPSARNVAAQVDRIGFELISLHVYSGSPVSLYQRHAKDATFATAIRELFATPLTRDKLIAYADAWLSSVVAYPMQTFLPQTDTLQLVHAAASANIAVDMLASDETLTAQASELRRQLDALPDYATMRPETTTRCLALLGDHFIQSMFDAAEALLAMGILGYAKLRQFNESEDVCHDVFPTAWDPVDIPVARSMLANLAEYLLIMDNNSGFSPSSTLSQGAMRALSGLFNAAAELSVWGSDDTVSSLMKTVADLVNPSSPRTSWTHTAASAFSALSGDARVAISLEAWYRAYVAVHRAIPPETLYAKVKAQLEVESILRTSDMPASRSIFQWQAGLATSIAYDTPINRGCTRGKDTWKAFMAPLLVQVANVEQLQKFLGASNSCALYAGWANMSQHPLSDEIPSPIGDPIFNMRQIPLYMTRGSPDGIQAAKEVVAILEPFCDYKETLAIEEIRNAAPLFDRTGDVPDKATAIPETHPYTDYILSCAQLLRNAILDGDIVPEDTADLELKGARAQAGVLWDRLVEVAEAAGESPEDDRFAFSLSGGPYDDLIAKTKIRLRDAEAIGDQDAIKRAQTRLALFEAEAAAVVKNEDTLRESIDAVPVREAISWGTVRAQSLLELHDLGIDPGVDGVITDTDGPVDVIAAMKNIHNAHAGIFKSISTQTAARYIDTISLLIATNNPRSTKLAIVYGIYTRALLRFEYLSGQSQKGASNFATYTELLKGIEICVHTAVLQGVHQGVFGTLAFSRTRRYTKAYVQSHMAVLPVASLLLNAAAGIASYTGFVPSGPLTEVTHTMLHGDPYFEALNPSRQQTVVSTLNNPPNEGPNLTARITAYLTEALTTTTTMEGSNPVPLEPAFASSLLDKLRISTKWGALKTIASNSPSFLGGQGVFWAFANGLYPALSRQRAIPTSSTLVQRAISGVATANPMAVIGAGVEGAIKVASDRSELALQVADRVANSAGTIVSAADRVGDYLVGMGTAGFSLKPASSQPKLNPDSLMRNYLNEERLNWDDLADLNDTLDKVTVPMHALFYKPEGDSAPAKSGLLQYTPIASAIAQASLETAIIPQLAAYVALGAFAALYGMYEVVRSRSFPEKLIEGIGKVFYPSAVDGFAVLRVVVIFVLSGFILRATRSLTYGARRLTGPPEIASEMERAATKACSGLLLERTHMDFSGTDAMVIWNRVRPQYILARQAFVSGAHTPRAALKFLSFVGGNLVAVTHPSGMDTNAKFGVSLNPPGFEIDRDDTTRTIATTVHLTRTITQLGDAIATPDSSVDFDYTNTARPVKAALLDRVLRATPSYADMSTESRAVAYLVYKLTQDTISTTVSTATELAEPNVDVDIPDGLYDFGQFQGVINYMNVIHNQIGFYSDWPDNMSNDLKTTLDMLRATIRM